MVVDNIFDALSDVIDVLSGHAAHRNSTVLGHVNAVLLDHGLALRYGQTSEGEHADLSSDMRPVALDSLSLNCRAKSSSHVVHASANNNELIKPLLAEGRLVEDLSSDSSTVLGRRRVVGADNDLDLRENAGSLFSISADEVEAAGTLAVETHDLGERLGNDHIEALVKEEAEAIGILVEAAGSEALVSSVEEGVKLLALANISNLLPLGLSRVNTSRVMGAGVEKDARARLSVVEISNHALDIETLGLLVEVAVLANLDTGGLEDRVVVAPGWVAHIEGARPELGKELTNDTEGTSTREGLNAGDTVITDKRAVEAEENTLGTLAEFSKTVNRKILLVESSVSDNSSLSSTDNREYIRLAIVITVSADTEVDLLRVLISLETLGEAEDGVNGGHRHVRELFVEGSKSLHCECVDRD